MDMPERLAGRVAIVTGASRGIGAAIASGIAQAGARVFAISRSGGKPDINLTHKQWDLSKPELQSALFQELATATDKAHILVNAAAISLPSVDPRDEAEIARMRQTLELNLISVYALTLAALPLLRAAGGGSIINITSINSVLGFPGNPSYVASKAALAGLTRALAVDLASDNIRVNAIAPGYVRSAMTEASYANERLNFQRRRHTLLNRWGTPENIVGTAIFLASDDSAYITGQEIFVDGGWTVNGLLPLE